MHTNLNDQDSINITDQSTQPVTPAPNAYTGGFLGLLSDSNLNDEETPRPTYLDLDLTSQYSPSVNSSISDKSDKTVNEINNSATVGAPNDSPVSERKPSKNLENIAKERENNDVSIPIELPAEAAASSSCTQADNTEQPKPTTSLSSVATENAEKANLETSNISKA